MIYISTRYYGYTYAKEVDSTCYDDPYNCDEGTPTKGWIYNSNINGAGNPKYTWLLSAYADYSYIVHNVETSGEMYSSCSGGGFYCGVRPVIYLTSDVKIISGTGKENDPYILQK